MNKSTSTLYSLLSILYPLLSIPYSQKKEKVILNKYCATFYTHYGAIKFNKICGKLQIKSRLMPVPRKVSSSCTTCVFFDAQAHEFIKNNTQIEDLEECFLIEDEKYIKVETNG